MIGKEGFEEEFERNRRMNPSGDQEESSRVSKGEGHGLQCSGIRELRVKEGQRHKRL